MTEKIGQPEQSDVTFWGVSAVVAGGIAVISTTIMAFVPAGFFGSLHTSRLEGGTLNQLRAQVDYLNSAQVELGRRTNELRSQFSLSERNRTDVRLRIGALETSIPMLLEVVPPGAEIDPLSITASIETPDSVSFDTEGGSVTVSQSPLFDETDPNENVLQIPSSLQPVPQVLENATPDTTALAEPETTDEIIQEMQTAGATLLRDEITSIAGSRGEANLSQTTFGIAVGDAVTLENADALWADISGKIGTLLIGLEPAISDPFQNQSFRVVVGPISNYSEAEMLCGRIDRVGIECLPVQYAEQQSRGL